MAEIDLRIIGMLAIALCLLSLTGLIFVRHHHQRKPSVLRLTSSETPVSVRDYIDDTKPTTSDELKDSVPVISAPATALCESNKTSTPGDFHISEQCLQCICHATTQCKISRCSSGQLCGRFRISPPYWADAGKLTLDNEAPDTDGDSMKVYFDCVNDPCCAARTVKGYIGKYVHDCNGDKVIDCYDYAAIHIQGPSGCKLNQLPGVYALRFEKCFYDLLDTLSDI